MPRPLKRLLLTLLLLLLAIAAAGAVCAQDVATPAAGQAAQAAAQADAVAAVRIVVRVLPRVEVPGEEFTLGEVAELDGADLQAVRRLAAVSLGRSPQPGRSLRLNEPFLRGRLGQVPGAERVELNVPPGAEVVRAAQVIAGADIAARVLTLAEEQAGPADGELEQELATPVADAVLPRGEVDWQIEPLGRYLAAGGARTYRVVAKVRGDEVWRALVRVNQQVFRKVVVATRAVRRNQIVGAEDVTLERKPVTGVQAESYLTRTGEVVGTRAKRPIGRGEQIGGLMVNAVADVAEGGPVLLVYETEQVRFTSPGVALVPAKVGAFIPVRNLESGRIVYGVVQPADVVKVN
jgi:flagella basal body P-ring formation protein FlgA